jgi:phage terminase Nu1 subunit (DNA packaging protein)
LDFPSDGKMLPVTASTSDLCELFAVTRKTIATWTAAGVLTRRARGRFNLIEAVQAHGKLMREQGARARAAQASSPGIETGAEARARLARLRADIAEEQFKRDKGEVGDVRAIWAEFDKRMIAFWREVRQIPWVMAGTLSFIDREMATLMGRELQRCFSNISKGRPPNVDGPDTDFDPVAEDSLLAYAGKGMLSPDGERIAAEARARRARPQA